MYKSDVHRICDQLSDEWIITTLNLKNMSSIRAARADEKFPGAWYGVIKAECDRVGVPCPMSAFRWREGDKLNVTNQADNDAPCLQG